MSGGGSVRVEPASTPPYEVVIGEGVLHEGPPRARALLGEKAQTAALVFDDGLPAALRDGVAEAWQSAGWRVCRIDLRCGERAKTIATLEGVLSMLAEARVERGDVVVAIGGGVLGDLAGFAAASYRRGVAVMQCPTTLLSMVDASVGGKTGVNLSLPDGRVLKNMVGAFHQPRAVLADVGVLGSLPDRELRCGLAECIKHGLLAGGWGDPGLLDWTEAALPRLLRREPEALIELITRNVAVKARVVGRDERELAADGGRALLNLGHTFAHAIETRPDLSPDGNPSTAPLRHGEAVAIGLVAATAAGVELGRCTDADLERVRALVASAGLPTAVAGLGATEALVDRMMDDKKAESGRLRIIVPTSGRTAEVVASPPSAALSGGWSGVRLEVSAK